MKTFSNSDKANTKIADSDLEKISGGATSTTYGVNGIKNIIGNTGGSGSGGSGTNTNAPPAKP